MKSAGLPTDDSWPPDEAHAAVLRSISELWESERRGLQKDGHFHFLLVERWSSRDDGGDVAGEVEHAWLATPQGLQRIDDAEHAAHARYLHDGARRPGLFPFVLVRFWVAADGRSACFGVLHGSRTGRGGGYLVARDEHGPLLVPDPDGGEWIS